MEHAIDAFVGRYVEALLDQNAAVFAGAGLSIPAGLVDWKALLRDIAAELGLDVDKEHDLITLAQFHVNEHGGRHRINQTLVTEFCNRAAITENHRILAHLPIRTYWTTNYDTVIEQALHNDNKKADVKITPPNLATTLPRRDAIVYKMHGDISQPDKAVITKDDYEAYEATRHLFSTALQGDLVQKTFLFLGFSFSDPNLNYILSRIRVLLGENTREHYCLLRRVQKSDFKKSADYQYARAKQELQVRDLKRYGIKGLLVDEYDEYTAILRRIQQRYQRGRVFIAGSANSYAPWRPDTAQQFIQELTSRLVADGFGIISGYGHGVGDYVINGVLEELDREGTNTIDDRMFLRPFPRNIKDSAEQRRRWTMYREDLLSHAGIAVFVFGNKQGAAGDIVLANGIEEEFQLAARQGIPVLPVGCTGSMAAELHRRVLDDFDTYFPTRGYKRLFKDLGRDGTPKAVASRVITLIRRLQSGA